CGSPEAWRRRHPRDRIRGAVAAVDPWRPRRQPARPWLVACIGCLRRAWLRVAKARTRIARGVPVPAATGKSRADVRRSPDARAALRPDNARAYRAVAGLPGLASVDRCAESGA